MGGCSRREFLGLSTAFLLFPPLDPPAILMFSSPLPVAPAEPTSWSVQQPAPRIGESPQRPGSFHARPDVVQPAARCPLASSAHKATVSCDFTASSSVRRTVGLVAPGACAGCPGWTGC